MPNDSHIQLQKRLHRLIEAGTIRSLKQCIYIMQLHCEAKNHIEAYDALVCTLSHLNFVYRTHVYEGTIEFEIYDTRLYGLICQLVKLVRALPQ